MKIFPLVASCLSLACPLAFSNLVDLKEFIPNIEIDLKYATEDNFTGQKVYSFNQCLLLKEAANNLLEVQKELIPLGLRLKVWDGFRPMSAQWKFWELIPDERYVSDPRKGGRHTRGTAIDLTLITLEGKELPMPSKFDDFSEKAHRNYMNCQPEEIRNRELLQTIMEKHSFIGLPTEWWHFDLIDWEKYPPIEEVSSSTNSPQTETKTMNAPSKILRAPSLTLIGIRCRTTNDPQAGPKDIQLLWERFFKEEIQSKIPNKVSEDVIALYCDYEGDYTKPYSVVIGCAVKSSDKIPEGMVSKTIPEGNYAVFNAIGQHPQAVIETWSSIWNSPLQRTYSGDYELYSSNFLKEPQEVQVFIAVE